jgi:uncharacterized protein
MPVKPLNEILVKPAGPDCNMACTYCFYRGKGDVFPMGPAGAHRMGEDVLDAMLRQFLLQGDGPNLSIGWQGGEPTLMGLNFFKKAMALEERYGRGREIGNGFQTNGILLDRSWAQFFRQYRFLIGLSIDGPEPVHDHYRRLAGGGPTWAKVSDSARMLLDAGVQVNALAVITDHSARFPDESYAHLKELGLTYMQFIPCVETGPGDQESLPAGAASLPVTPEAYGAFLCRVFDLWRADFRDGIQRTSVRFFESLLLTYAGFPPPECTLRRDCGSYIVVEHNGDVYSCDFFVEPAWKLGNLLTGSLSGMLRSRRQSEFGKMKADLHASCRECEWLSRCRGGCTRDRLQDARGIQPSRLCGAYRMFFAHADAVLKRLVAEWKRKQAAEVDTKGESTIARNAPCPCGSGRKYKRCCGKEQGIGNG